MKVGFCWPTLPGVSYIAEENRVAAIWRVSLNLLCVRSLTFRSYLKNLVSCSSQTRPVPQPPTEIDEK